MRGSQPPAGYDTHWSRLIDAGLAGLYLAFQSFDPHAAERLMRAWWPLMWLLPTIAGMAAIAWRIAGREAAMVALLLALVGVPAYQQFTPGRIDHHNVQIALTLLVMAATAWSDRKSLDRGGGRLAHRSGAGDRLREPALSRDLRRRAGAALCVRSARPVRRCATTGWRLPRARHSRCSSASARTA